MNIDSIDHFVLIVLDVTVTLEFYTRVLGIKAREIGAGRWALQFGSQKINLQQLHMSVDPHTRHPNRGAGDFCLLTTNPIGDVIETLRMEGVQIVDGPCERVGATGPLRSVYFYDPDEKLIEVSNVIGRR